MVKKVFWWEIEKIDQPKAAMPFIRKVVKTISKEYYGGHREQEPVAAITAPLERRHIVSMSPNPPGNIMLTKVKTKRRR